jgi:putative CocE/NonD family hydrolase
MRRLGLILSSLVMLLAGIVAATPAEATLAPRLVDVTARDGVTLRGNVLEPGTPGRKPGVLFITSWATPDAEYLAHATALAQRGYVVLAYTPRGFGRSGGTVQVAGPADITDVSDALDWMVAHTSVDPARIGVGGVSYGAGIGLIAAGHDPRIRAVLAMSGWADLVESLYSGRTRRLQTVAFLALTAELSGRPSPEMRETIADYYANRDIADVMAWARVRSAATHLPEINANAPAIFLANAYGDSIFGPNQLVDFYGRLTGPKRIQFAPGDHATVEGTGLTGLPNHVWTDANRWLDRYVAGERNGIDREDPIALRSRTSPSTVETYATWDEAARRSDRYALDGALLTRRAPRADWSRTITSGVDTTADAGVMMLTNAVEQLTAVPPVVAMPTVGPLHAAVWTSAPVAGRQEIRGATHLRLETQRQPAGTVVAYLYDVDALGIGRLVVHEPMTWTNDGTLDIRFPVTSYDVPAGHRLALVVDTVDPLYADAGPLGAPLGFTGRSWLDLPLR